MLMARAGLHPDFVPALHHLLHAAPDAPPCRFTQCTLAGEERDHEWTSLRGSEHELTGAGPRVCITRRQSSIVVFAEEPWSKEIAKDWEIQIPSLPEPGGCRGKSFYKVQFGARQGGPSSRIRNLPTRFRKMKCGNSPVALHEDTIVFTLAELQPGRKSGTHWTDVFVLDAWGSVLARADIPQLPR